MKVPANLSAERLIVEYLSRVTVAGLHYLPKGRRIAFVSSTRGRIERETGPAAGADPARVREVLARLGEPEDLVRAERARLDAERVRQYARNKTAGEAEAADIIAPLQHRPVNSRWRPATRARPQDRPPGGRGTAPGGRAAAPEDKREGRLGGLIRGRLGRPPVQPGGQAPPGGAAAPAAGGVAGPEVAGTAGPAAETVPPAAADAAAPAAGTDGQIRGGTEGQEPEKTARQAGTQAPGGEGAKAPSGAETQQFSGPGTQPLRGPVTQAPGWTRALEPVPGGSGPGHGQSTNGVPPAPARSAAPAAPGAAADEASAPPREPRTLRAVATALGHRATQLAWDGWDLFRQWPLESVAVVLIGLGGLILPVVFWPAGGLVALWSRAWDARDKWIALLGPAVITLLGTVVIALIVGGQGDAAVAYWHALRLDWGYLLRIGSVLCAAYLVLRVRHGPRRRVPPWQR